MSHATPPPPGPPGGVNQIHPNHKAKAHAPASQALGLTGEMLEQLVRAQELSHSLNFRLESERLPSAPTTTANTQQEQAVLL